MNDTVRPDQIALLACACVALVVGLAVQYRVAWRDERQSLSAAAGREPPFGRAVAGDLFSVPVLCLVAVYLLSRLIFLTRLPVYVDESIHIAWAQASPGRYFVAELSTGRWLPMQLMTVVGSLPLSPLFAARLASVLMGLATLLACVLINRELFSITDGLSAGIIYATLPFALLYDRLALVDIYLTAFGAWLMFFAVCVARHPSRVAAMGLSLCVYAAILSKVTGGMLLVLPLLVAAFLLREGSAAYLKRVLPTLIGGAAFLIFLVSAGYGKELLASQVALDGATRIGFIRLNLGVAAGWAAALLTPAVAVAATVAFGGALVAMPWGARAPAFVAALLLVSVLPYVLLSTTWYPAYLLFTVVPISLLLAAAIGVCARTVSWLVVRFTPALASPARHLTCAVFLIALIGATLPLNLALTTLPESAALPPIESRRYIEGPVSGYGLPELAGFLREQAEEGPINVVRFRQAAPPMQGLDVYLVPSDSLRLFAIDPGDEKAAARIADLTDSTRTLFVSNPEGEEYAGISATRYLGGASLIWSHVRPGSRTRLEVWEVPRKATEGGADGDSP